VSATLLAVVLAGCGGSKEAGSTTSSNANTARYASGLPVSGQKKGGTLKILSNSDFDHLDPGAAYYQLTYVILYSLHRPLYFFRPQDPLHPIPDLAAGPPRVSADNKTVTVKIKHGIRYGTVKPTPIDGKEVTSADVKYAIQRGQNPHVANGYTGVYFPLVGLSGAKGGPIAGIQTPDRSTLVLHLSKPFGATTAKALSMPITMPVPKSYAAQFDAKNPTTYDADPTVQAFTGPYMIAAHRPGKSLTVIRNPHWDPKTDTRPAYPDRIEWTIGNDVNVAGRQIFDGRGMIGTDISPAPIVKLFATKKPKQIAFSPLGYRIVSLNTQKKPFSNIDVRKAAAAILDRTAMQRVRGGPIVGDVATHFLTPGIPGFTQAGGFRGTGADYLRNPGGDLKLAESYMKKAGYPSGRADGQKLVLVGDSASPDKEDALIVANSLDKLGFKVQTNLVELGAMYTKYCDVKSQQEKIDLCANVGWLPDFPDPYAMLNATFNGESIVPVNNTNWSLFDNKTINAQMDKAALIADPAKRAQAWGKIDRDLVTQAAAIPWFWDKYPVVSAPNVQPVVDKWNAMWDPSYTSLK